MNETGKREQDQVQGEGNYEAARKYDKDAREFAQRGDVDKAARDAEPRDAGEAKQMDEAERAGKERAKDEDPLLSRPERIPDPDEEAESGNELKPTAAGKKSGKSRKSSGNKS